MVVVGAAGDEVAALSPTCRGPMPSPPPGWSHGMSASLAAGLGALADTDADCAVVDLVDTPDVQRRGR